MAPPYDFDGKTRAELLTYLVVCEMVAMARTGNWLRTDHLVESARVWSRGNGAKCDWMDRVAVAELASTIAPTILASFQLTTEADLAPLFVDGWLLDYRLPIVCDIHKACANYLRRSSAR
jgi:hypothetical protein